MTKWEYKSVYPQVEAAALGVGHDSVLNEHGADGWELVSVDGGMAYFKRSVPGSIQMEAGCGCTEAVYQGKPCDNLSAEDVTERLPMHGCVCEGECDCWEKYDAEESVR